MFRRFDGLMTSLSRNGSNKFPVSFATVSNKFYLLLGVFLKQHPLDEIHIFRQTSLPNQERITTYLWQLKLLLVY